jgi:hypothetical protein
MRLEPLACAFGSIALLAGCLPGTGILPAGLTPTQSLKRTWEGFLGTSNPQNARHLQKQTNIARSKDGNLYRQ